MGEVTIKNNASGIPGSTDVNCIRTDASGQSAQATDEIINEHFIELSVNGIRFAELSCTPDNLTELVIGRLYTERIISEYADIKSIFICGKGNIAEITLTRQVNPAIHNDAEPTCCTGNKQFLTVADRGELKKISPVKLPEDRVFELINFFGKDLGLHKSTSGTHSCLIMTGDGVIRGFEDISRHNALDKAVGYMVMNSHEPSESLLFTSGRIAADMAIKTVAAGVPVLISKAAPTSEALRVASEYGLTLIGKAWPDSYLVYTSPDTSET